ncbi:MAG TPA: SdpI family protein [Phenylobacterium sp.]|nr:SdpI family protein [Phenylobacterium sp.]
MRITLAYWISSLLVAAGLGAALWAWIALPEGAGVPIHYFGIDGHRHAGTSREIVWLIPVVALVVLGALKLAGRRGGAAAPEAYEAMVIGVTGVLLVAEATLIGRALQPDFNVMGPVALAVGVLLLALGNVMGKARRNAVFGLRTPWTLADARVWDKAHRFLGRAWVLGGFLLVAAAFALRDGMAIGVSIAACTALPPLFSIVWSRRLARG